jgi:hypothetical protein
MFDDIMSWVGLSGLLAIIGGAMGYGKLKQEITQIQQIAADAHKAASQSLDNRDAISALSARFDERTVAMMREMKEVKDLLRDQARS